MTLSRRAYRHLITLGLVVGVGLASRLFPIGFIGWDKYLGDVLYAAVFYLGLSLVWPQGTIPAKMIIIGGYVTAIEFFQLTSLPAHLGRSDNLVVRLFAYGILGSRFSGWDLLAYGIGLAGVVGVERLYLSSALVHSSADGGEAGKEIPR